MVVTIVRRSYGIGWSCKVVFILLIVFFLLIYLPPVLRLPVAILVLKPFSPRFTESSRLGGIYLLIRVSSLNNF